MFLLSFTLHFQVCMCTDKIKTLLTKKSKFHFVQYLKQIVPCESIDKGVSSRRSRVRTKFYGSIIDSGSEKGFNNKYTQFNDERAVQTLKPSSAQKNALREYLVIFLNTNLLLNLPTGFPASVFQSLQTHSGVFCNLADSFRLLASKKVRESWYSWPKKTQLHVASQVQAFQRNQRN